METVEIDKKIASLREEIEKLEKQKNDSYKKACDYKLMDNWYNISKIIDLLSLIQLMNRDEDMPNKYNKIIQIIEVVIEKFY